MRLRMNQTESGRCADWGSGTYHCKTGHEYDVPDELGKAWVRDGVASVVRAKRARKVEEPEEVVNDGD